MDSCYTGITVKTRNRRDAMYKTTRMKMLDRRRKLTRWHKIYIFVLCFRLSWYDSSAFLSPSSVSLFVILRELEIIFFFSFLVLFRLKNIFFFVFVCFVQKLLGENFCPCVEYHVECNNCYYYPWLFKGAKLSIESSSIKGEQLRRSGEQIIITNIKKYIQGQNLKKKKSM